MTYLSLSLSVTEHRLPIAMSDGSLRDVGGPGAHLPSYLRGS